LAIQQPLKGQLVGVAIGLFILAAVALSYIADQRESDKRSGDTRQQSAVQTPSPSPNDNIIDRDNHLAKKVLSSDKFGPHFACKRYPRADVVRTRDLVPTSNVIVTIEYDESSKSYKVTQGDDRVAVQHSTQDIVSYEGDSSTTSTEDRFTWKTDKGVETYAWFKEYRAVDGTTWGGGELYGDLITDTPRPVYDRNLIIANRSDGNSTLRYVIVFTDTATCKGADTAPGGMWKDLADAGLNLPQAARL
jgi:hypothetical protein